MELRNTAEAGEKEAADNPNAFRVLLPSKYVAFRMRIHWSAERQDEDPFRELRSYRGRSFELKGESSWEESLRHASRHYI